MASENIYENVISNNYNNFFYENKTSNFEYLVSKPHLHHKNKYEVAVLPYTCPSGWDNLPFGSTVQWLDEIPDNEGTKMRPFGTEIIEPGNYTLEELIKQVNKACLQIYKNYVPNYIPSNDEFMPVLKIVNGFVVLKPGMVPDGRKSIIKVGLDLRGLLSSKINGEFYELIKVNNDWVIDDDVILRKPDMTNIPYSAINVNSTLTESPLVTIPVENRNDKPTIIEETVWHPVIKFKNPVRFWVNVDNISQIENQNINKHLSMRLVFKKLYKELETNSV